MTVGTSHTRIVDSRNYDDALDVITWLREVVGAQPVMPHPDEIEGTDVLFKIWDQERGVSHEIRDGAMFVWVPETGMLDYHPPKPAPILIAV